jgi:hypothetical protein
MAIAHDAVGTFGATPDTASPMAWTHTPVGTPRGVVVLVVTNDTTDTVTGVTYGGTAMTRVRWQNVGGENGSAYAYFLGASVPTGAQSVSVAFTGSNNHMGCSATVTAADDTSVHTSDVLSSTSLANPSITLTTTVTTITYGALYSGTAAPANTAPDANHTDIQETDLGAETASCIRRSATVAAGSPAVGWTSGADDVAAVALAVREGVAGPVQYTKGFAVITSTATPTLVKKGKKALSTVTSTATPAVLDATLIPAPDYLFRDEFTTDDAAPITAPRTAEPGPGEWAVTDTGSKVSIASSRLNVGSNTGSGDPELNSGLDFTPVQGTALKFLQNQPTDAALIVGFRSSGQDRYMAWNPYPTNNSFTGYWYNGTYKRWGGTAATNLAVSTDYQYAIVRRSSGAYLLVKGGACPSTRRTAARPRR